MKTRVDQRFCLEAREYRFRFACADCAHFVVEGERCANEYPNLVLLHLRCEPGAVLEFCKEFELA